MEAGKAARLAPEDGHGAERPLTLPSRHMSGIARRLFSFGLGAAVGLALMIAGSTRADATQPVVAKVPGVQPLLVLDRPALVRAAPNERAARLGVLPARTPLTRSRTVLPVIEGATGPEGVRWLRVRLPVRPNGATGWVQASSGSIASTGWEIVVHRAQRLAVVMDDGKVRGSFRVVVGKRSTPTPLGTFFVVEKLRLAPGVSEGPWALATSAHSDALRTYAGGDGQVALHGTVGFSAPLGSFASHGCIRFAPSAIAWIAQRVDAGTPVIIVR
jgi:lipoprotein-anchoring transpeptidase ErfK/SrfK